MQCELLCTFQTYVAFAYLFVKLKRAAHGPHRSYEKHFQAINKPQKSYDYIQTNWLKVAIVYRLKGMQASIWTKKDACLVQILFVSSSREVFKKKI